MFHYKSKCSEECLQIYLKLYDDFLLLTLCSISTNKFNLSLYYILLKACTLGIDICIIHVQNVVQTKVVSLNLSFQT